MVRKIHKNKIPNLKLEENPIVESQFILQRVLGHKKDMPGAAQWELID